MVARFFLLLFVLSGADGSRIIGGRDAAPHSLPYMASVQLQGRHLCGGALVREDFVLTAAHCETRGIPTVVLGVDSLTGTEPTKQQFLVVKSFPHPDYDGHKNDIMLLKVRTTAVLFFLLLISFSAEPEGPSVSSSSGDLSETWQEVNVTTLPQMICKRRWGQVPITQSMVCGVGSHSLQGFCSGDSGGPLVCDGDAAGVISFSGRRCGDPQTPDVYTRISSFRAWIQRVLNDN
uniref:trypsin n=1 Tax=Maylandia zebra TaxID=106582 RepID=A0A3P9BIQ2_9CICH